MTARDTIVDLAWRLRNTEAKSAQRVLVKKLLVGLWRVLPVHDRVAFKRNIEAVYPYDFIEFEKRFPESDDPELEIVARHWGYVLPTLSDNDLQFARSFEKLIRIRRTPSQKQAEWAKRLYREWKKYRVVEDDSAPLEVMEAAE